MRRSTCLALLVALLIPAWGRPSAGFQDGADEPRAWALVVGVGNYPLVKVDGFDPLYATNDAKAVADWLVNTAGWPSGQVRLMTSNAKDPKLKPTRANLQEALSKWIKPEVRAGDLVFIYFAGQTFCKPDLATDQPEKLRSPRDFLLPVDFQFKDAEGTGWALDRDLAEFYSDKVQVFCCLDTSTAGRGSETVATVTPANRLLKSLTPWPGWAAWIASDNLKASLDREPGFDGSPFRNRLLRSLGSVDGQNNMMTSLNSLKTDEVLIQANFRTQGKLNPKLNLWSGKVAKVEERGLRPVLRRGHGGTITGLIARTDGAAILSSSLDSTVKIWKPGATLELDRTLTEPIGEVGCIANSTDGRWIVAGSGMTDRVWLWDQDGKNIPLALDQDRRRSDKPIRSIGFLPNSQAFVTVNNAGQAQVWDVSTKQPTPRFDKLAVAGNKDFIAFATTSKGPRSIAAAAFDIQGRIHLLEADSRAGPILQGLGPETSALDLSSDGRTLALGDEQGVCETFDLSDQKTSLRSSFRLPLSGEKVQRLKLHSSGWLAIGTNSRLRLLRPSKKDGDSTPPLLIDVGTSGVRKIRFSDDGRLLAAILRAEGGGGWRTRLWRLDDGQAREIIPEPSPDRESPANELAFAGGGLRLLVGTEDGTIRSWTVDDGRNQVVAKAQAAAADKSQIRSISPSPDGKRFVLICEEDKAAFVFDFDDRASTRLKHTWNSLSFLPDGRLVGIIDEPDPSTLKATREFLPGRPVVYDLDKDDQGGDVQISDFLPPETEPDPAGKRPDTLLANLRLDRMVVSSDGERIAAIRGAGADRRETFFWEKKGGRPVLRWPSNEQGLDRVNAVALARLGSEFVACTPDVASLRVGLGPELRLTVAELPATPPDPKRRLEDAVQDQDEEFTAAAFAPRPLAGGGSRTIALGTRNHGVVLWTPEAKVKKDRVRRLGGSFRGEVETLTFTDEGRWLVATTNDKRFTAWEVQSSGEAVEVAMEPLSARHEGVIRDVRAWPKVAMVATAGADSTVRFWSLKDHQLIGTLAFSRAGSNEPGSGLIGVAFSPDGRFDCLSGSQGNYKMVRQGQSIRPEEATESYLNDKLLIERMRTAQVDVPKPVKETLPPNLVLSALGPIGQDGTSAQRTLWLEVLHDAPPAGAGSLTDLRLYRNNIPVGGSDAFEKTDDPRRFRSRVTLRKGSNEFRAVAARSGATEGSSDVVQVKYFGEEVISRVHVLAIGIDKYPTEALKLEYAVRDAQDISHRLKELDVAQFGDPQAIETLLLKNEEVDEPRVNEAFRKLRDKVRDRPEDKVVVFLAGHTEQFGEEFGLLLIKNQPGAGSILKYSTILQGLARLDAGQRLVIVDACQTDRILARGKARELARREIRAFTNKTLKYPTQYILASKAGEPALENKELQHGLLTYTLLCGLGSLQVPPRLKPNTSAFDSFSKPADENGDGTVGTDELNRYASSRLPLLAAAYPDSLVARGNPKDAAIPDAALRVPLSFDPTNASFGLVKLLNARP